MTRRGLLAQSLLAAAPAAGEPADSPNVLLIMTDQQRMDSIGAYGNPVVRTPNLDALAAGGTRFTNCWTQHPVCMPSRASIFTGRYPSCHGVRTNGVRLPLHETTLAQAFLAAGYDTFGAGKFHFIPHYPYRSRLPSMDSHPEPYYGFREFHLGEDGRSGDHWRWIARNYPRYDGKPDSMLPLEAHNSHWVASHTIDYLKRAASRGRTPFFAFASFVDPHHPYNPPPPYRDMYKAADMPPVIARPEERDAKPPHYNAFYEMYKGWGDPAKLRAQYYGEVTFIDDSIGRILRTLEEFKLRRNTLIVFVSDHGDLLGDHYLFTKGPFHYRHCASVPLIVNWPGHVSAGKVIDGIVQEIDLMPTILHMAGVSVPEGVQGRSQHAVLNGWSMDTGYTSALIEHRTSGVTAADASLRDRAVVDLWTLRTRKWRLSYYPSVQTGELYDLENDPDEFRNLWNLTRYDQFQRTIKDELMDRILQAQDPLPRREKPY